MTGLGLRAGKCEFPLHMIVYSKTIMELLKSET